jgi:hypothetical protein
MSLQCRRMPSFLAIADFLRPQSLELGSTFIYGVRISFESFSGVSLLSCVDLQLLNIALHRLSQIGNQVIAIRDLNRGGSALSSSIGIQARPIPGDHFHLRCKPSQRAKLSAHRSGSRSITCERSKSISMVP